MRSCAKSEPSARRARLLVLRTRSISVPSRATSPVSALILAGALNASNRPNLIVMIAVEKPHDGVVAAVPAQQVIAPKRDRTEPHYGEPLSGQDQAAPAPCLAQPSATSAVRNPACLVSLRYSLGYDLVPP